MTKLLGCGIDMFNFIICCLFAMDCSDTLFNSLFLKPLLMKGTLSIHKPILVHLEILWAVRYQLFLISVGINI